MKILISYFLILAWILDYIENYPLDFKRTFTMGIAVMIYSITILLKDNKILNKMKTNISRLMINLSISVAILPSTTCIALYKYNVLNYENSRDFMMGKANCIMSLLILLGLILIPILIIYLPNKIIKLINN